MQDKKRQVDGINNVYFPGISRLLVIFGISLLFIQFLSIPVLAQSVEYLEGYNVITNDDGSKEIISGALNYLRWDGVWRPNDELNISNGSWPYLYSENKTTADFKVDDTTLSLPTANTKLKLKQNSISYDITFSKSELQEKEKSINLTSAFINLPYDLTSRKPKNKYKDKHNIKFGRLHFKAGMEDIAIHDDTLRDYIEGGEVVRDVTYLFPGDYDFGIDDNGEIRLEFKKKALEKLTGNITIEIRTWDIIGPGNWGGNVAFYQTSDVKSTGNVELKQMITDYALYTRFDEGSGTSIHNENPSNVLTGTLLGTVGSGTWTAGKYGQAIHFDGVKNKVLFNDHPDFRLGGDFTISFYIRLTSDVDNQDSDITRKGSTATADPDRWTKVEIKSNKMQGVAFNGGTEIAEKDTVDRRNGNWYFVAYTRGGTTCSLIVDGSTVASRSNCPTNTVNNAQLAIGAKDTETSGTGKDYTHGTIDEVRFFNRKLSASDLTSIKNNEHFTTGTVSRNLNSLIGAGEEIKEMGCYGTWDSSITKVNVMASADNNAWTTIKSNAAPNVNYAVNTGNNYKYSRCSLSTTDSSKTPIIQSMRTNIGPSGSSSSYTISVSTSPSGLTPQPAGGGQYTSGQTATVTAQSVNGYTFQRWTEGGSQVSTSASYQFTVTGNRNLVAVYAQNTGGSLAGWWKFDTDMNDWSGNGNDGTCSGSGCPISTTGKIANALYFDGTNDYINAGNGASLDITGSITIEAWIKPGRSATAYIVKKASKASTDGYELSLSSSGKAFFRVNEKTSGNTYRVDTVSSYPVDGNTWVHLVGLYNGNQLQIYLNGNLENSKSGPSNILSNTDNFEIGGPDDSVYYRGAIDEVRIWNRALTPQEIEDSYNAPNTGSYTISVSTSPSGLTPQPAGGGQYNSGQSATVTAQKVFGYTFQRWTENGNQVSTSASYQFTVSGNRNLVAVYAKLPTGTITGSVNKA